MTATFNSTLRGARDTAASSGTPASETEPRKRKDQDEIWAFAIAETLLREVPRWRAADSAEAPPGSDAPHAPEREPRPAPGAATSTATLSETARTESAKGVAEGGGDKPVERLTTELSDARLGRLELTVARGVSGLTIVINVADAHVKALIEADQATLMKSLQDCGLRVASVRIGQSGGSGTALAEEGSETARVSPGLIRQNPRWRAYRSALDDENADDESVDFTA